MNLPQRIKPHQYDFTLSNNKKIKFTPWRVKDEQEYMYATEGIEEKEYKLPHIEELLSKTVDDDINFGEFSELDFFRFAIEVRKYSKGSDHEVIFTCPNCGTTSEPKLISLDDDVKIKPFVNDPIYINDLVFELREVSRAEIQKMKEIETDAEKRFEYVVHSISSISVNDEIFTNLSVDDIRKYIGEELTSAEYEDLSNKILLISPSIIIEKKIQCEKCNLETLVYVDNISDFFE